MITALEAFEAQTMRGHVGAGRHHRTRARKNPVSLSGGTVLLGLAGLAVVGGGVYLLTRSSTTSNTSSKPSTTGNGTSTTGNGTTHRIGPYSLTAPMPSTQSIAVKVGDTLLVDLSGYTAVTVNLPSIPGFGSLPSPLIPTPTATGGVKYVSQTSGVYMFQVTASGVITFFLGLVQCTITVTAS